MSAGAIGAERPSDLASELAPENAAPEVENKFHDYVTHRVPWFVHLLWVCFWALAIWYVLSFLFPSIPVDVKKTDAMIKAAK